MRVIVCGGREFRDEEHVWGSLNHFNRERGPIVHIAHGGARGADRFAADWAYWHHVTSVEWRAQWAEYGKRAGPIRNQQMLDETRPDCVIAFKGGLGTADMIRRAETAGVPVHRL